MGRAKGSRNRNRLGPVRPYLVRLPIEVADRVDAAAAAEGVPVAAWLRNVLRREAGLWTGAKEDSVKINSMQGPAGQGAGQRRTDMAIGMTTKTIETLARECADEAWAVLLQGATVSRVDGEVMTDDGTNVRPVTAWEPMQGDWEALDDLLGYKASRGERTAFDGYYRDRLVEIIKAVE